MPNPEMPSNPRPSRGGRPDANRPSGGGGGNGNGNGNGGGGGGGGPFGRGAIGWIVILALVIALVMLFSNNQNAAREITWSEFLTYAKQSAIDGKVMVEEERLLAVLKSDTPGLDTAAAKPYHVSVKVSPTTKEVYVTKLMEENVPFVEKPGSLLLWSLLLNIGAPLIFLLLIMFIMYRAMRGAGGGAGMLGAFGRSRHKVANKEHSNITLADVAGIQEAKEEVGEIIEFLKNPKKFQRLGGRVPRGVLLIGEPGCGKTLLAKAVAGEADVPFFSISGSDFVEMFVGVGASRVRDLFKQAKDSSPCIIFLDEIDAVGRRRGQGFSSGGHDEREQTLNAILVEMDGFESNDQVIVIAATNRSDVLDPALTRPGRFDRQITVPLPDIQGRVEILKVHAKRIKTGPHVDLERLARGTPMFSGADLAAIINEAAIAATLTGKEWVEQDDLEEARDKVKWGRARKSRKVEQEERVATAYHEAGHAVLQKLLPHADPLHKVTIIPRGQAMGATISLPEKDRYGYANRYLQATLRVLCGGRIAEEKKTNDISSGASMDIRMATAYARHMILEWGMSDKLGFVNYSGNDQRDFYLPEKDYSDQTALAIDQEVKQMIDQAYQEAKQLIEANWDKVIAIAEALLQYETLSSDDVDRIMKGQSLNKPTVGDLLKAEAQKSSPASASDAGSPSSTTPAASSINDAQPGLA